jgi:hypothetical protein
MNPCRMAGGCPNEGTVLVRIPGVGDRRICASCLASMQRMGMDYRVLDETTPVPLWRQRNLAKILDDRSAA